MDKARCSCKDGAAVLQLNWITNLAYRMSFTSPCFPVKAFPSPVVEYLRIVAPSMFNLSIVPSIPSSASDGVPSNCRVSASSGKVKTSEAILKSGSVRQARATGQPLNNSMPKLTRTYQTLDLFASRRAALLLWYGLHRYPGVSFRAMHFRSQKRPC